MLLLELFWGTISHVHIRLQTINLSALITPPTGNFLISLPLLRPAYYLRHNTEIRLINKPTMSSTCSNERNS